jgi:Flp pilus assembly protein TadG
MRGDSIEQRDPQGRPDGPAGIGHAIRRLQRFIKDRAGNVYVIFAIVAPILLLVVGAGIDYSYAENTKRALQDATDAATLAVSAAVARNPNLTVASLQILAQTVLAANLPGTTPTISDFHVCAPVQNDCAAKTGTMVMNTVLVATQAAAPCTLGAILPQFCSASHGTAQTLKAQTTTVIGFGATMQLNLVMDTSASMIVGSTPADVTAISNWMSYSTSTTTTTNQTTCTGSRKHQTCTTQPVTTTTVDYPHWNAMIPGDPGPAFASDNPQCAFACHDLGGSTTSANIAEGLANAKAANATTRFDVMINAANKLLDHVNTEVTSSTLLAKNNYVFNLYGFDTTLHTWGTPNMPYATASGEVGQIQPGLDTNIDTAMNSLATTIGKNGTGGSVSSPLKFVMLVTDGLQSNRDSNWCATSQMTADPAYGGYKDCPAGTGFDSPMNTANCTTMKNNGIVLAVLETPYVPLDGSDPNVQPYEKTVRRVIYPSGAGTASTVSAALSTCASPGYYFQATNASDIASGFVTLTDKFLSQMSYIAH